jgi:hypothetical protein
VTCVKHGLTVCQIDGRAEADNVHERLVHVNDDRRCAVVEAEVYQGSFDVLPSLVVQDLSVLNEVIGIVCYGKKVCGCCEAAGAMDRGEVVEVQSSD